MPETEPTSTAQSEIDAYAAAQKAQDKQKLLEAVFDDSLTAHADDEESQARVAEGTEYYKHLETLSQRDASHDPMENDTRFMEATHEEALADNEAFDAAKKEELAAIEKKISADPRFRRLLMMAFDLSSRRNQVLTGEEDADKLMQIAKDKEDKFQELFDWYEGEGADQEALEYILDKAFSETEAANSNEAGEVDENGEKESTFVFELGQEVKKQRTGTGVVEDGWRVDNFFTDAHGNRTYLLKKDGLQHDNVSEDTLKSWQTMDVTEIQDDSDAPLDETGDEAEGSPASGTEGTPPNVVTDLDSKQVELYTGPKDGDVLAGTQTVDTLEGLEPLVEKKRGLARVKEMFTLAYIGERYTTLTNRAINRGTEGLSDEDAEKKRNQNRGLLILGGVALFVGGAAAGAGIHGLIDAAGAGSGGGAGGGGYIGSGEQTAEVAPVIAADPNFNIPNGGGGIDLLTHLNVPDPEGQWVRIQDGLVQNFPTEFYQNAGEEARIMTPGQLSIDAQQYIKQQLGLS